MTDRTAPWGWGILVTVPALLLLNGAARSLGLAAVALVGQLLARPAREEGRG